MRGCRYPVCVSALSTRYKSLPPRPAFRAPHRYYRIQVCISAFFMLLLDLLQLLQLVSLLAQWPVLHPRWPYLPLVVFQLINMATSNVQQVCISVLMDLCSC